MDYIKYVIISQTIVIIVKDFIFCWEILIRKTMTKVIDIDKILDQLLSVKDSPGKQVCFEKHLGVFLGSLFNNYAKV